jgi:hypothetical protein
MKVDKISVSFDPVLGDEVRSSAKRSGQGISRWLAEAAAEKLRRDAFADFLANWQQEHGVITPQEMIEARTRLGLSATDAA